MTVRATFRGLRPSLGFEPGQQYTLQLLQNQGAYLYIVNLDNGAQRCPYSSLLSFLKNWRNITMESY